MPLFRRGRATTAAGGDGPEEEALPEGAAPGDGGLDAGPDAGTDLPPSRMRGTEALYGYVVGAELLVVAVLNLVVRGGSGAPAHPDTFLQVIGVAAAVAFFAVLQTGNRTIVGFAAIVAAFFVTLPKGPSVLAVPHVLALAVPLAYGLLITQRQRRATLRAGRPAGRAGRAGRAASTERAAGRGADRRRGRKAGAPTPTGPRPNSRYTPPKAKRGR